MRIAFLRPATTVSPARRLPAYSPIRVATALAIIIGASLGPGLIRPANAAVSCSVSITNINFGNVDVLANVNVDTTATITSTCSGGSPANHATRNCVSLGKGSQGDATSRQLVGPGGALLRYDLYSDSLRTVLWGSWQTGYDTTGVSADVPFNGSTTVTVYARLLASQQTALPGAYSSTFTANPFVTYFYNPGTTTCPSGASNASTSFTVSATVITSCKVSATTLNFGSAGVLTSNVDATSTVAATCTSTTPYNMGLNAGTGTGATVTSRKMTSGGATINYSLYSNSGRTTNWGNTVGTDTVAATGSCLAQNNTVYGRVPSQTTPAPATYLDTIVATVTY
jgi:spore coat protein U-like protein